MSSSELKVYLKILIKFGIMKPPHYRYVWSCTSSYRVIADATVCDHFEKIKQCLHFNNISKQMSKEHPDFDKLYKIHPIIDS